MKKRFFQNLLLLTGSLLVCLIGAESAIRYMGAYDPDGNFIIHGRALKPFHLPVLATRRNVEEYRTSVGTRSVYDGHLGWAYRPGHRSADGLYGYNSLGARTSPTAPVEYTKASSPGTLRIVLVGDSYTHGDEVPFTDSWGYRLEKKLKELGTEAEVINLAVGAYGMDQAFLRWARVGSRLSPHVVIFGLQMENVQRNVNLLKSLYQPNTGLPFSKPRYILSGDGLQLINDPPLPPEQVAEVLGNMPAWDLAAYEHFLRPEDYEPRMYLKSKLIALLREISHPIENEPYFYDVSREPARLAQRIIRTFKSEVEASGSRFLMVHIPTVLDLVKLKVGRRLTYADLLAEIEADNDVVHCQDRLLQSTSWTSLFSLFMPGGHYSAGGNELIAQAIADHVISLNLDPPLRPE